MKKTLIFFVFVVVLLSVFSGCAMQARGTPFKYPELIPEDSAILFVYRPSKFAGSAVSFKIQVNSKEAGRLSSGGCMVFFVKPGVIDVVASSEAEVPLKIMDAKAGQAYYVKCSIKPGVFVGRPSLVLVPEEVADGEIKKCRLVETKYQGVGE
jgi:hypothetical protein